jgi:hypothetical protein
MIRTLRIMTLLSSATLGALCPAREESKFALPAAPVELVTEEAKFRPFAENVRTEVERLFTVPAAVDDRATLSVLLSTRVHLAHHFGDNERAVSTAAWIRSLQPDPALRAFAGLTTLAAVEARRRHPGTAPGDANYRATFRREFTGQLAQLPRTPEIATMLRGQREKIAGLTEAALLAETRDVIIPALARRGHCGLAEADQLVRVRHRMVSILPLKAETVQALDAAIAARSSP